MRKRYASHAPSPLPVAHTIATMLDARHLGQGGSLNTTVKKCRLPCLRVYDTQYIRSAIESRWRRDDINAPPLVTPIQRR